MSSEGKTNRHSISCKLVRETPKAWLLDTGDDEVWFPKSQGELYERGDGTHDLFGEEWLLKEKGLI
jgi:hypothetical protein